MGPHSMPNDADSTRIINFTRTVDATPVRSSHVLRPDTEGRRTRYGSPPPPPGVSPSLLLPTPGRVASNASEFASANSLCSSARLGSAQLTPLSNPVFESPGDVDLLSAGRDRNKHVQLHQWALQFTPVTAPMTVCQDSAELTHWIVLTGQRSKGSVKSGIRTTEKWHSSLIFQRLSPTLVSTSSGRIYELVGAGRTDLTNVERASGYSDLFKEGFPEDWWQAVTHEARGRGYACPEGRTSDIKRDGHAGRKRPTAGNSRRQSTPPTSPIRSSRSTEQLVLSPKNVVDLAKRTLKLPQKTIPRELRQLQSSKLGNITMVQTAILEGLHKSRHDDKSAKLPSKGKIAKLSSEGFSSSSNVEERATKVEAPLRTSNRARNTTSEWWKVEATPSSTAQSSGKKRKAEASERSLLVLHDGVDASSEKERTDDEYQTESGSSSALETWRSRKRATESGPSRINSLAIVRKEPKRRGGKSIPRAAEKKAHLPHSKKNDSKPIEDFFVKLESTWKEPDASNRSTGLSVRQGDVSEDILLYRNSERNVGQQNPPTDISMTGERSQQEDVEPDQQPEIDIVQHGGATTASQHIVACPSTTTGGGELEEESSFYFSD